MAVPITLDIIDQVLLDEEEWKYRNFEVYLEGNDWYANVAEIYNTLLAPKSTKIKTSHNLQFVLKIYDESGVLLDNSNYNTEWEVESGLGNISNSGLYSSNTPTVATIKVTIDENIEITSVVNVTPGKERNQMTIAGRDFNPAVSAHDDLFTFGAKSGFQGQDNTRDTTVEVIYFNGVKTKQHIVDIKR